jgi:phosphonate transport system substrate-binding protein
MRLYARRGKVLTTALVVLFAAAVPTVVFGILLMQNRRDFNATIQRNNELVFRAMASRDPVTNALDTRFVDADSNLVADAPADRESRLNPDVLRLSWVPDAAPDLARAGLADLATHLSNVTGKPVEIVTPGSVEEQLKRVSEGNLHITTFNTGAVPLAVNAAGFVPLAAPAVDGQVRSYRMLILARNDAGIRAGQPSDLRDKEIAFTSLTSNSGYKAPKVLLMESYGLKPGIDYRQVFSGGHVESIRGLIEGTFSVITVASDILDREVAAGGVEPTRFVRVYESAPFPPATLGVCHQLDPALAGKVREALLSFDAKDTSLASFLGAFSEGQAGGFAGIDYRRDFEQVRLIDDRDGTEHVLPAVIPADPVE